MTRGSGELDRRGVTLIEVLFGAALISILTIAVASMLRTAAGVIAMDDHQDAVGAMRSALADSGSSGNAAVMSARVRGALPGTDCREVRTTFDGRVVRWLVVERPGVGTAMYMSEQISEEEPSGSARSTR